MPIPGLYLGVTCGFVPPLAEVLDLLHGQGEAAEVEQAVEQHRSVPVRQDEAVPIAPCRVFRIDGEVLGPQDHGDVCHAHRHAGVSRVRLLDRVHGQGANRVRCPLFDRSRHPTSSPGRVPPPGSLDAGSNSRLGCWGRPRRGRRRVQAGGRGLSMESRRCVATASGRSARQRSRTSVARYRPAR